MTLPIDDILPPKSDLRIEREDTFSEEFSSLLESVKANGILEPLIVMPGQDSKFQLIAGSRRLRAAMLAGLQVVPAVVKDANDIDAQIIALSENLHRKDLSVLEKHQALTKLYETAGYDIVNTMKYVMRICEGPLKGKKPGVIVPEAFQQLSEKLGLSPHRQWQLLRLNNLSEDVVNYAEEKGLTGNKVYMLTREAIREKPLEEQKEIINEIAVKNEPEARKYIKQMENPEQRFEVKKTDCDRAIFASGAY